MQHFSKKDLSILLGNIFDHYNSSIYGFVAPLMAPLFFPNNDPIVGLILAYSIWSTSLFSRPIGSYLFSVLAQNKGPVYSLSYSLIGAAIISIIISLLPSHTTLGKGAAFALLLAKFISDIFTAGENAVARIYILEDKQHQGAYKTSYIYQASSVFGIILASLIAMVASNYGSNSWRLCYVIGGITGLMGYYLRVGDSKSAKKNVNQYNYYKKSNLKNLWLKKVILLRIAIVTGLSYITYTVPFVIMNNYVPLVTDISLMQMMEYNTIFLIVDLLLICFIGNLTRNHQPQNIMLFSSLILAMTTIPLWQNLNGASLFYVTLVRFIIVVCGVAFMCPINLWFKKLISSPDQYLVVNMGSAFGSATIGKLSPVICLSLWHYTQSSLSIAIYIVFIALGAIWAIVVS